MSPSVGADSTLAAAAAASSMSTTGKADESSSEQKSLTRSTSRASARIAEGRKEAGPSVGPPTKRRAPAEELEPAKRSKSEEDEVMILEGQETSTAAKHAGKKTDR